MSGNTQLERKLLKISTLSSFFFAAMGMGLGLWMGSLVIIFDGAYSLVSLCLTSVSLCAAIWIRHPKAQKGIIPVEKIEPLVIAFKGFVITLMCAVSFHAAVMALLSGGHQVNASLTVVFGVINFVGCFACYRIMAVMGKKTDSLLVEAESKQWIMDTIISASVLIGFAISFVMVSLGHETYAQYADPSMVILASLYFGVVPLKMIFNAIKTLQNQSTPFFRPMSSQLKKA
jgi:predicted Co/Zn/Cd cation transporter (cation efflux family)